MGVEASNPINSVTKAVGTAIRKAAQTTGVNFNYLVATAKVESDLNPNLTMRSSSATGLFQFLEQTWLETVKQAGNALGYGRYASAIKQTPSGNLVVQDADARHEILALRKDPTANAVMAGAYTQNNAARLASRIGRQPNEGELYIAHFFGPAQAAKLINTASVNPQANGAAMFPRAAHANRPIFYDKQGNARTVTGVYDELVRRYQFARATSPAGVLAYAPAAAAPVAAFTPAAAITRAAAKPATSAAVATPPPVSDTAGVTQVLAAASETNDPARPAPSFYSLFSDGDRRTPVSSAVAHLWTSPSSAKSESTAAAQPSEPTPLNLFHDLPSNGRALFEGNA